jgi:hypothetical protein
MAYDAEHFKEVMDWLTSDVYEGELDEFSVYGFNGVTGPVDGIASFEEHLGEVQEAVVEKYIEEGMVPRLIVFGPAAEDEWISSQRKAAMESVMEQPNVSTKRKSAAKRKR